MIMAIIQARMGSTRLPGKVLADINGRPMLWHVVHRVQSAKSIDHVVVATSVNPADDPVAGYCLDNGYRYFRGSETDVLDRYYQAAKQFKAETVVRITADCPLMDPLVVDKVVKTFLKGDYDYVTNTLRYTFPDGIDVEVFSFPALKTAWQEAKSPLEREHVTPYLRNSGRFRICNVENEVDLSNRYLRWTVDEPSDLEFIRALYSKNGSGGLALSMDAILRLLDQKPELTKINNSIICNHGYYKSIVAEPPVASKQRELTQSYQLKAKALQLIPSGTQTFSKAPTQFVQGVAPVFLKRGQGSHVWDVDGNEYIDYPMALGPIILGHHYPAVTAAVIRQIHDGTTFSLPHPLEVKVAELLVETIPCAEMVRFGKNGSDATAGAVRVARGYTGKDMIACCGYHGWQDWYIGTTTRNKGVPSGVKNLTVNFDYNNISSLERIFSEYPGQVAAVIMEPVGVIEPTDNFLQQVQAVTRKNGALLVFDEVITGFRLALGGAQDYYGVTPDLACFGKAMANGYPLSAVAGRRDVMEWFDEVFFSFTFGGETLSLAAAKATISEMKQKSVISHLWEQGRKLKDGYNVLAKEFGVNDFTECIGLSPRTVITFKDKTGDESLLYKSLFQQECLRRGVLFSGGQNICFGHSNADVDHTLRVYRTAMEILATAVKNGDACQRLEGEPVKPVFRKA
ncbi:MAG: aminotransferase class III-fold pyridoxal phosphate-dependent enzyme [Desulfobacterales bacterium]|uniref:Aminotransferase class III-fold pyridoxal phosphate-dependent enzyme n=1 Tax=Candidatus Desulfatibia vada TaxID=2841696 RepID=A0A8J6NS34_9BACT|nr:aminotransferase class III-fold pyridoxal phosphate-dependent enzyme [Candidatus Desulfatibia vada]